MLLQWSIKGSKECKSLRLATTLKAYHFNNIALSLLYTLATCYIVSYLPITS